MASALQRIALAVAGTSMAMESPIGLPMSRVSRSASSSWCSRIRSAKRISTRLRAAGACKRQIPDSNAWRAAITAASASASSVLATVARKRPSTGLMLSKVSPLAAQRYSPPIKARPSRFRDWKYCSQSLRCLVIGCAQRKKWEGRQTVCRYQLYSRSEIEFSNSASSLSLHATNTSMYSGSMYRAMTSLSSSSRRASRRLLGRLCSFCS